MWYFYPDYPEKVLSSVNKKHLWYMIMLIIKTVSWQASSPGGNIIK